MRTQLFSAALLAFCLASPLAVAPIALELSLVIDVSGSIDISEYNLQRAAYSAAFNLPSIQSTIAGLTGGIAVNVIQFDSSAFTALPWTLLTDNASVSAFANSLASMARQGTNGGTNILAGLNASLASFAGNSYDGTRMVMDVSGDGEQISRVASLQTPSAPPSRPCATTPPGPASPSMKGPSRAREATRSHLKIPVGQIPRRRHVGGLSGP